MRDGGMTRKEVNGCGQWDFAHDWKSRAMCRDGVQVTFNFIQIFRSLA